MRQLCDNTLNWHKSDSVIRRYVKYGLMWITFSEKQCKDLNTDQRGCDSLTRVKQRFVRLERILTKRIGFPFWTHCTEPPGVSPTEHGMLSLSPGLIILVIASFTDELLNALLCLSVILRLSTKSIIKQNTEKHYF